MATKHDETKLPKWAQRELADLRFALGHAHAAIVDETGFLLGMYRLEIKAQVSMYQRLEERLWSTPK